MKQLILTLLLLLVLPAQATCPISNLGEAINFIIFYDSGDDQIDFEIEHQTTAHCALNVDQTGTKIVAWVLVPEGGGSRNVTNTPNGTDSFDVTLDCTNVYTLASDLDSNGQLPSTSTSIRIFDATITYTDMTTADIVRSATTI